MDPQVCHWDSRSATDNQRQHTNLLRFIRALFPLTSQRFPRYSSLRTTVVADMSRRVKGTLLIDTYVMRDLRGREYRTMRAEFQPRGVVYFSRQQTLAVMLGQHQRLGADSWLKLLPPEVLSRDILSQPNITETQDPVEFRAFLERFVESEEVRLDQFFGARDEEFYDTEKSFRFYGDDCGAGLELAGRTLRDNIIMWEPDAYTGEICLTLYADPERRHEILLQFDPSGGLIIASGLGVIDDERDSDGTYREPGCFAYFLTKLRDKILES